MEVARLLVKRGVRVIPMMTHSATRFVGPVTLTGICGEETAIDMWDPNVAGERHVAIAAAADVIALVPTTADMLARLASGRADDLVTATVLCARGPVVCAPAMHPRMWSHPATQANVAELARQGRVTLVGPVHGEVASGESGVGRMIEPAAIVEAIFASVTSRELTGKHIVITAGPTFEPIDPVRFIGNRSSGKMGFALATRAAARGADVTLIAGPVSLATPAGVTRVDVGTAEEMRAALARVKADAIVMSAAVADLRPTAASPTKIKKDAAQSIALVKNPDLIAEIGAARAGRSPVLVAFALETGDDAHVLSYAKQKLAQKKVDLVVANAAHESLGKDSNRAAIVSASDATPFESSSKEALADRILDRVVSLF